jgi:hypothetical protein
MKQKLLLQYSDSFDETTRRVPEVNHQIVLSTNVLLPMTLFVKTKAMMGFFLWGFVKDNINVPPLPTLHELKTRIREICANTDHEILHNV